jgi:hypothetical protein
MSSSVRVFKTGTVQKDLELTVKYSGINIYDIDEVTDLEGNFSFPWEAFLNSISGVDYLKISEIASPLVVRSLSGDLHIYENYAERLTRLHDSSVRR